MAIFMGMVILLFILFEGASSTILFLHEFSSEKSLARTVYTKYDPLLGWINIPNFYVRDLFGPGIYYKTNSQCFRNNRDFSARVAEGKIRVICSGDSFTQGLGVDNDHNWSQLLTSLDKRIEAINMGQGGYGADQAYLWYKRDGAKLDHQIHMFAFTNYTFLRMPRKNFIGYGKPVLRVRDGILVTENVPIPSRPFYLSWLTDKAPCFRKLRTVELLDRTFAKFIGQSKNDDVLTDSQAKEAAEKMFESLLEINKRKNSRLILLFLPTRSDYASGFSDNWRNFVHASTAKQNILLFDLIDDFRKIPVNRLEELFIPEGDGPYRSVGGHYTVRGNTFVANRVYASLLASGLLDNKESILAKTQSR